VEPLLVNQTRWSDLLKQLGVVKGLDHVELSATLAAAIVLENDRPEHKYLAGEALAWGQLLLAAQGAGIAGYVGIRNPAASGKLVVVEEYYAVAGQRYYVMLARGPTVTQANTEQPRDTRLQPSGAFGTAAPNIAGQVVSARSDTIAVTPFAVREIGTVANEDQLHPPVVLAAGDVLFIALSDGIGGLTLNSAVQANFAWRERTLEPSET
jgi:hypothetical protein